MNQSAELEEYDEQRPQGFLARMMGHFTGRDEYEDEDGSTPEAEASVAASSSPRSVGGTAAPLRRSVPPLRLDYGRRTHVTVRLAVRGFDDARSAADGLKSGQQQIVNLEQTPVEMAERVIDFLNGATYALDGSVEKIGEQVYLFTPPSVTIDIEEKPAGNSRIAYTNQTEA